MAKPRNPFVHHHDHGHDHGHDHDHGHHDHAPGHAPGHEHGHAHAHDHGPSAEELDPAQQSLADALRVSFTVLKVAMVVLLVVYLFSNFFTVPANHVALRLRFGKIVGGSGGAAVITDAGPHPALPYPIEEVVLIPTTPQTIDLTQAFWFAPQAGVDDDRGKIGPLDPEQDGSLLTGDANIVHARWTVNYHVAENEAADYITNVGSMEKAEALVRAAAEQAIVHAVAQQTADDLLVGSAGRTAAQRAQEVLREMRTGIAIDGISGRPALPGAVRPAYQEVVAAQTDKAQQIEQAQRLRDQILGETAGEASRALWDLIREYQQARGAQDDERLAQVEKDLDTALRQLRMPEERGGQQVSGRVANLINQANTYSSRLTQDLRGEASRFASYHREFRDNPRQKRVIMNRLYQDTMQRIMARDIEVFVLPKGQRIMDLGPDPDVRKRRQERQYLREQAEAAARTGPGAPPPR